MSAATDSGGLTPGDWARYAGLFGLGTLVFLVIYDTRDGALVSLLAIYLGLAAVGLLVVGYRKRRS